MFSLLIINIALQKNKTYLNMIFFQLCLHLLSTNCLLDGQAQVPGLFCMKNVNSVGIAFYRLLESWVSPHTNLKNAVNIPLVLDTVKICLRIKQTSRHCHTSSKMVQLISPILTFTYFSITTLLTWKLLSTQLPENKGTYVQFWKENAQLY